MASVRVPPRYARVNAWVISRDTDAEVRWLASAFGAVETPGSRILDPDGDIGHVEVELGDSVIMLFDAKPGWPPTPAHLRVYVGDVRPGDPAGRDGGAIRSGRGAGLSIQMGYSVGPVV